MPQIDDTHLVIKDCLVVYDGINRPDEPNSNGNIRRKLKVVINPNNPDLPLLDQLATAELQRSEFKGILPNGGTMPIGTAGPNEFNGQYTGWAVVNCSTFKMPDVYDEAMTVPNDPSKLQMLTDPLQYSQKVYAGQIVDVMVNCSAFNNVSKGVAARMDGFMIRTGQNAPRQNFGGGGADTSSAFGGGGQQNNGGYNQNANNGGGQQNNGGYNQNANNNGGQNNGGQNNGGQQNNGGPQAGGGAPHGAQNNGGQQAHEYLPNNQQ